MRTFLRRAGKIVLAVVAVLLVPAVGATISAVSAMNALYRHGPDRPVPPADLPVHDPAKPTAVVVLGDNGAVVSDVLAPYETLAATGKFNVYTVAPNRRPLPLTGGLDLVPDLSFADLDTRLGGNAPNLAVVPALPDVGEPSTDPVKNWLRAQSARGTMLQSVCNGAGVLASAGLLDGRAATAHWERLGSFESTYPAVNWLHGKRYVDDGNIVTTAGILSGIDGTLHVIERFTSPAVAEAAAKSISWPYYGNPPPVNAPFGMPAPAAIANAAWTWLPPTVGVLLTNGVGEIELASVFDPTASPWRTGPSPSPRTATRSTPNTASPSSPATPSQRRPALDRLLVPGTNVPSVPTVPNAPKPVYIHGTQGFPYIATITDLARTTDVATARWTAKVLEMPMDGLTLDGPAWPWRQTALLLLLLVAGTAAVVLVPRLVRRVRT
ncbi:DJ-1/PfpI family protein [Kibdelosporangium lantanae]